MYTSVAVGNSVAVGLPRVKGGTIVDCMLGGKPRPPPPLPRKEGKPCIPLNIGGATPFPRAIVPLGGAIERGFPALSVERI